MSNPHAQLRLLVYTGYSKATLVDDLSMRYSSLRFSSALHGGFKDCYMAVPMPLDKAWNWLNRENLPGYHFYHLEISEQNQIVWEGRIMDIELRSSPDFHGLALTSFGYWSSMRDRLYKAGTAVGTGNSTDWTVGGPSKVGNVINEMITLACPDINGTANVTVGTRDITGLNLGTWAYPQDIIVDKLAPLSDTGTGAFYCAVWENRKPYYTARSGTGPVDWYCYLQDVSQLRLTQQGKHLRNSIRPIVGTVEGTSTIDAESTATYPRRELLISLPAGVSAASANEGRDAAIVDKRFPAQDESFNINGHLYSTKLAGISEREADPVSGAIAERPKWWVRAGQMLRINDLVPASAATPTLDNLRTFHILEATYNADNDSLVIQPDRPPSRLDVLLARIGTLELKR